MKSSIIAASALFALAASAVEIVDLTAAGGLCAPAGETEEYWMWGHHPDSFDVAAAKGENYNFPKGRRIDMADACRFLGVGKCCVVRWRGLPAYPYDDYARQFTNLDEIAWSIVDSGKESFAWKQNEALRLAGLHGNLTTFFLDDFFNGDWKKLPPDDLRAFKARARAVNPKSRLACVLYADTNGINPDFKPSLDVCDVVSLWFWNGKSLTTMRAKVEELRRLIGPEKKVLLGIYLWDFGGKKPLTRQETAAQLATAEWLLDRRLVNGLIFHCTPLVDLNLDSVDCARTWLKERKRARNMTGHTRQMSFNAGWEYRWEDEAQWKGASVPHDAARLRGFDSSVPGGSDCGFFCGGVLRYRKTFLRPAGGGRFSLRFDGLYMDSTVSLNGRTVGGRRNGYVGFEVPLEGLAETNLLEVALNCFTPNARWYAGAGILRNVWLVERTGFAADPEAVSVTTELKDGRAIVRVSAEGLTVVSPEDGVLEIAEPRLWTPETPNLYTLDVTVRNTAGETDVVPVRYGIRTVEFTVDRGLLLNGKPYRLKGLCQHEGFGCLGTALDISALRRQLAGIKSVGANAVRTAHHPFAPEFYDLCDEMGLLVFAELLDDWKLPHRPGYHAYSKFFDECAVADVKAFVRRDRNHPSVLIWSIGNEVQEVNRPGPLAAQEAKMLYAAVKGEDPTRAVTFACSDPKTATANGSLDVLDVVGLNYNADWFGKLRGKRPVFGSETAAAMGSRDTYLFRVAGNRLEPVCHRDNQENAYSLGIPFNPAAPMEETHKVQQHSLWSAGEFAWCYQDYLGEGFRHDADWLKFWPARSTYWGLTDTAGMKKDRYWFYKALWSDEPTAHLMPDWNLAGFEKKLVPVWCYTNGEEAELFLNGRSLGVRRACDTGDLHLSWDVPYEPGKLEVRARMKDGTVVIDSRETVGKASAFRFTTDWADEDRIFLRVDAVDASGRHVIAYDRVVVLQVEGAELLCVDNGDATDHASFVHPEHPMFRGSLMLVLRPASPKVAVTAKAPGIPARTWMSRR